MHRIGLSVFVAMVVAFAVAQSIKPRTQPVPALPFYDWRACPFEGCSYREWTARKPVDVYDTWKEDRQSIARLSKGDKVLGVTGVVITIRPGVIRMDRELPEQDLKRGDTILTYTYRGEGFSSVWYEGRFHPEFDISFAKWPDGQGCGRSHCSATYVDLGEKVWWAKLKLKSGRTGWVNMDTAEFDGVDMLAKVSRKEPLPALPLVFVVNASVPQFQEFPAAVVWKGPATPVKLASQAERTNRTRLAEAGREPPNFAGHYRFVTWGCGPECVSGSVIDLATGKVISPPHTGGSNPDFGVCQSAYAGSGVEFHVNSRLVIVRCGHNFDKRLNRNVPDLYYFVLEHQTFKEILRLRGREALARNR